KRRASIAPGEDENRTAEGAHAFEPDIRRLRHAGVDPAAQLRLAGSPREPQLGEDRPRHAALGNRFVVRGGEIRERGPASGRKGGTRRRAAGEQNQRGAEGGARKSHHRLATRDRASRNFFSMTARSIDSPSPLSARSQQTIASAKRSCRNLR